MEHHCELKHFHFYVLRQVPMQSETENINMCDAAIPLLTIHVVQVIGRGLEARGASGWWRRAASTCDTCEKKKKKRHDNVIPSGNCMHQRSRRAHKHGNLRIRHRTYRLLVAGHRHSPTRPPFVGSFGFRPRTPFASPKTFGAPSWK
jgi:hypothetical protein